MLLVTNLKTAYLRNAQLQHAYKSQSQPAMQMSIYKLIMTMPAALQATNAQGKLPAQVLQNLHVLKGRAWQQGMMTKAAFPAMNAFQYHQAGIQQQSLQQAAQWE